MASIRKTDQRLLAQLSQLALCNPFTPERLKLEQQVLGKRFKPEDIVAWNRQHKAPNNERPNVTLLTEAARSVIQRVQQEVNDGKTLPEESFGHYWNVATYALLYRHIVPLPMDNLTKPAKIAKIWQAFEADYRNLINLPGLTESQTQPASQLFALLCQIHRAFYNIFTFILGNSLPSAQLRATVWESIFTCDLERYRNGLFDRMSELPTLITGPSGTGKELVARAIGLSQFISFDPDKKRFVASDETGFLPLNLSAMSANLIESELFGHRKGSFTGAISDREGWLEQCPESGAVFLDEIGELEMSLQVKLLRVVQQRTFSRIGETTERTFCGKLIGATNRDLSQEMKAGRFREDLYYRLCADRIQTPGLREQLDERPDDLHSLTQHIARKVAGTDSETLGQQACEWILNNLGANYPWRGNIRELEQCVSSIMIRGSYTPADRSQSTSGKNDWTQDAASCQLTADELLQRYCTWIYYHTDSYEAAAKKLKIDRRTVKAKVDPVMLENLQASAAGR